MGAYITATTETKTLNTQRSAGHQKVFGITGKELQKFVSSESQKNGRTNYDMIIRQLKRKGCVLFLMEYRLCFLYHETSYSG